MLFTFLSSTMSAPPVSRWLLLVVGRPVIVGFELSEATVAELQANYIDNPDHNIYWSLNGGPQIAVKIGTSPPLKRPPAAARPGPGTTTTTVLVMVTATASATGTARSCSSASCTKATTQHLALTHIPTA